MSGGGQGTCWQTEGPGERWRPQRTAVNQLGGTVVCCVSDSQNQLWRARTLVRYDRGNSECTVSWFQLFCLSIWHVTPTCHSSSLFSEQNSCILRRSNVWRFSVIKVIRYEEPVNQKQLGVLLVMSRKLQYFAGMNSKSSCLWLATSC